METDGEADFEGAGVLETVVDPRVGTGGITIFETSTLAEDFLAELRLAEDFFPEDFLTGRFAALVDFFTALFAGRLAAAFFGGRFTAFFFAATTTPSLKP